MENNILSILSSADAGEIYETLLKLPAEKYLDLYHMMKNRAENKTYFIPELKKGGTVKFGGFPKDW